VEPFRFVCGTLGFRGTHFGNRGTALKVTVLAITIVTRPAPFNRCARCTLGCTKIRVGCITAKGFTRMHHELVALNTYFLQKLSVSKNEPLTNQ